LAWHGLSCSASEPIRAFSSSSFFWQPDPQTSLFFQFFNSWSLHPDFFNPILQAWSSSFYGCPMFVLQSKLKHTKNVLNIWSWEQFGNGPKLSSSLLLQLQQVQTLIDSDPLNNALQLQEHELSDRLTNAHHMEADMMREKCREQWEELGDKNTTYYHNFLKQRAITRSYYSILNDQNRKGAEEVAEAFVQHYIDLLGSPEPIPFDPSNFNIPAFPALTLDRSNSLVEQVSDDEIKKALFSIPKGSAGGPDGYNSCFYMTYWDIVKVDFLKATKGFFTSNKILSTINSTLFCQIPKVQTPLQWTTFVPSVAAISFTSVSLRW